MNDAPDLFAILDEAEALSPLPARFGPDPADAPHRASVIEHVRKALQAEMGDPVIDTELAAALAILTQHNDLEGAADVHFQWGDLTSDVAQADAHYNDARRAFRELGDFIGVGHVRFTQGELALQRGDIDTARKMLVAAELMYERSDNLEGVANTQQLLARALIAAGETQEALALLEEAFEAFNTLGDDDAAQEVAVDLIAGLEAAGHDDEARAIREALAG